eukprot:Tbor_TRINITY_DN5093_c1_g2::TRINITY_DN5093_c1_g2_i1::g.14085::m.14085
MSFTHRDNILDDMDVNGGSEIRGEEGMKLEVHIDSHINATELIVNDSNMSNTDTNIIDGNYTSNNNIVTSVELHDIDLNGDVDNKTTLSSVHKNSHSGDKESPHVSFSSLLTTSDATLENIPEGDEVINNKSHKNPKSSPISSRSSVESAHLPSGITLKQLFGERFKIPATCIEKYPISASGGFFTGEGGESNYNKQMDRWEVPSVTVEPKLSDIGAITELIFGYNEEDFEGVAHLYSNYCHEQLIHEQNLAETKQRLAEAEELFSAAAPLQEFGECPNLMTEMHAVSSAFPYDKSINKDPMASTLLLTMPTVDPNCQILHFDHVPYHPNLSNDLREASGDRKVYTSKNVIQWTYNPNTKEYLSNSRIIQWSDGTSSLHIGTEMYTIETFTDQGLTFLAKEQTMYRGDSSTTALVEAFPVDNHVTLRPCRTSLGESLVSNRASHNIKKPLVGVPMDATPGLPSIGSRRGRTPQEDFVDMEREKLRIRAAERAKEGHPMSMSDLLMEDQDILRMAKDAALVAMSLQERRDSASGAVAYKHRMNGHVGGNDDAYEQERAERRKRKAGKRIRIEDDVRYTNEVAPSIGDGEVTNVQDDTDARHVSSILNILKMSAESITVAPPSSHEAIRESAKNCAQMITFLHSSLDKEHVQSKGHVVSKIRGLLQDLEEEEETLNGDVYEADDAVDAVKKAIDTLRAITLE